MLTAKMGGGYCAGAYFLMRGPLIDAEGFLSRHMFAFSRAFFECLPFFLQSCAFLDRILGMASIVAGFWNK